MHNSIKIGTNELERFSNSSYNIALVLVNRLVHFSMEGLNIETFEAEIYVATGAH